MFQDGYRIPEMDVILRVEGLAKGLIRKFKTMDPQTWKTSDLANILFNEMGIKERYTVFIFDRSMASNKMHCHFSHLFLVQFFRLFHMEAC